MCQKDVRVTHPSPLLLRPPSFPRPLLLLPPPTSVSLTLCTHTDTLFGDVLLIIAEASYKTRKQLNYFFCVVRAMCERCQMLKCKKSQKWTTTNYWRDHFYRAKYYWFHSLVRIQSSLMFVNLPSKEFEIFLETCPFLFFFLIWCHDKNYTSFCILKFKMKKRRKKKQLILHFLTNQLQLYQGGG